MKLSLEEISLAQTALHAHLERLKKIGNEQEIHSCIALCDKLSEEQVKLEGDTP